MGILDEAIREHLELKRDHGAEESEIKGLEAEAFGPADRPDATEPVGEAETRIISPGSSLTAPAGEGDQLDKVFDASNQAAEAETAPEAEKAGNAPEKAKAGDAPEAVEPSATEHEIPVVSEGEPPAAEATKEAIPDEAAAAESAPPPAPESPAGDEGEAAGDAGDALDRERENLASHPTEHYDVDAAIAEEEEIDVLSESSLSDELDRALDGPGEGEPEAEPEFEPEFESAPEVEPIEEVDSPDAGDPDTDDDSGEEPEDVLEETPDFLEETPEHDKLWFEQKEPKDFDFGD